jgi:Acetyltransferase (GNAT) family.
LHACRSTLEDPTLEWQKSLVAPQDDMWESFMNYAMHWELQEDKQIIGYASSNEENGLLQFFLLPIWIQDGPEIFHQFIEEAKIKKAIIGTNNPACLSIAMHHQKLVKVDTYLFTNYFDSPIIENEIHVRQTEPDELEKMVDFYHSSMFAPKEWLNGYLGNLNSKKELFVLEEGSEILGACEVRKSESDSIIANIGMVVSIHHRKKGLGTYLLSKAKEIAISWGKQPICSCEVGNIGSLKSIQRSGFRSIHQMLYMEF